MFKRIQIVHQPVKLFGINLALTGGGVPLSPSRRTPGSILEIGTGRSLSSGRPKAGPVGRCNKIFVFCWNWSAVARESYDWSVH
jgi:hypothetical protein